MINLQSSSLHPLERAKALDSKIRKMFQNPRKILKKYLQPGMTVLDLGCGTGYFTIEIAELIRPQGKVVASDVQEGMLEILRQRIQDTHLKEQILIYQNQENSLGITEKFDFILAFYSFHEMKYIDKMITELSGIVKPETQILISEQKFHVRKQKFDTIIKKMENTGYRVVERPKIILSRTVLMRPN